MNNKMLCNKRKETKYFDRNEVSLQLYMQRYTWYDWLKPESLAVNLSSDTQSVMPSKGDYTILNPDDLYI